MILPFLTAVMQFVALGVFLDTVLIGRRERLRLARYLEGPVANLSLTERFLNFMSASYSIVFDRFFSGGPFSISFFSSAALVSIVSFSIVVGLQVRADPGAILEVEFDDFQVLLIVAFVAFNILFDYFTIIQTKIFIETSVSSKSIFRSALYILADLIVTMNLFIVSYAAFILMLVYYLTWAEVSIDVVRFTTGESASKTYQPPNYLSRWEDDPSINRLSYEGHFYYLLLPSGSFDEYDTTAMFYVSTFEPAQFDHELRILAAMSRLDISIEEDFKRLSGDEALRLSSAFENELRESRFVETLDALAEGDMPEIEKATLSVQNKFSSGGELSMAYTTAFSVTDALEDGFPYSLLERLEVVSLQSIVGDTIMSEMVGNYDPLVVCLGEGGAIARFSLSDDTVQLLSKCPDFIVAQRLWDIAFTRDIGALGRDLRDRIVPFNTLLITSLLPTIAFYCVVALMAIVTLIFSYVLHGTRRLQRYFLRAPFSIACMVVAIPLYALGIL